MKIFKNMHETDKEALTGILFLIGTITLLVTTLWGYAILSGQA